MKSANIDSIKCEFSEYLFDKSEHPDWLPANPSKAGHKGLSIFGACNPSKIICIKCLHYPCNGTHTLIYIVWCNMVYMCSST